MNANNLVHSGPSQGGNIEDDKANESIGNCINLIVTVVAQMAAILNQANGMPIPLLYNS